MKYLAIPLCRKKRINKKRSEKVAKALRATTLKLRKSAELEFSEIYNKHGIIIFM